MDFWVKKLLLFAIITSFPAYYTIHLAEMYQKYSGTIEHSLDAHAEVGCNFTDDRSNVVGLVDLCECEVTCTNNTSDQKQRKCVVICEYVYDSEDYTPRRALDFFFLFIWGFGCMGMCIFSWIGLLIKFAEYIKSVDINEEKSLLKVKIKK